VLDTRTNHRHVRRSAALLGVAFPANGRHVRGWMTRPAGSINALSYWTDGRPGARRHPRRQPARVRARRTSECAQPSSVRRHGPDPRPASPEQGGAVEGA
jgi:hypothetical protein